MGESGEGFGCEGGLIAFTNLPFGVRTEIRTRE